MTIISTEMLKWKRNKTVLGIFILTAILGIFAVERAFSISRSSSLMNSFSDLYTLAFKNLTSLFLPIVLSMFATTLFFDEQKNDTLKGLLIITISKTQLYFSKIAVVIFMSLALCLLTFAICILGGFLAGGFTDLNTETILQAGLLFLAGGVLPFLNQSGWINQIYFPVPTLQRLNCWHQPCLYICWMESFPFD